MNIVDFLIIGLLLIYIVKGFSNGVIKESVSFVGGFGVIVIAFLLKNPISVFMYQTLPFFRFGGILSGISVLNIIIYEIIAFLLVASILLIIYQLIIKMTNILETILKITFVFALPSKILGALVGFIEGMVLTFLLLFVCVQFESSKNIISNSRFGESILSDTPILASAVSPIYDSVKEIYKVAEDYKDATDKNVANLECLEVLLKYKVLNADNADVLVKNGKLNMPGIETVIDKYRKSNT